ncbi:MAG TPA: hypothetical protein VJ867_04310 [Gemmatimonadaceae bacterium]|nr:hypothetical protein [Gemmatimonadaceae bacterium]
MSIRYVAVAVVTLAVACGKSTDSRADSAGAVAPTVATTSADVKTALAIDSGMKQSRNADSVLKAHNITQAGLDSIMYRIAADSGLRAEYAAARR